MATATMLLSLITMSWMHAVADPRCLARTMYQAQPVVFLCYGSGSASCFDHGKSCEEPETKVAVRAGNAVELFDIPVGTKDFRISFRHVAGNFHLLDPATNIFSLDTKIINGLESKTPIGLQTSNKEFRSMAGGAHFTFQDVTGGGIRRQSIQFENATTSLIKLRLENPTEDDQVYHLRYHYAPYKQGSQCELGGNGVGCKPYYQQGARTLAIQYAEWLRASFPSASSAWTTLSSAAQSGERRLLSFPGIPYYRWCEVYVKWPDAINTDCWKVYKFVSKGGLETNSLFVTREDFDFVWKLPAMHTFANACCGKLTFLHDTYELFAQSQAKYKRSQQAINTWDQCKSLQLAPTEADYMSYLDADGYKGFVLDDLRYCWDPRGTALATKVCYWNLAPGCVSQFTIEGRSVNGCTTGDRLSVWCSLDAEYSSRWRLCDSVCKEQADQPGCHWEKDKDCVPSFVYKGATYTDTCATVNHYQAWCSTTREYKTSSEEWRHCKWVCPKGPTTTTTTHIAPWINNPNWVFGSSTVAPLSSTMPNSCPSHSDPTKCLKYGGYDVACCATKGHASCSEGYRYKEGNICSQPDKVATCCVNPNATGRAIQAVSTTPLPMGCTWELAPGCLEVFSYAGGVREGCQMQIHRGNVWVTAATAWCSKINPLAHGTPGFGDNPVLPCARVCGGMYHATTSKPRMSPGMIALAAGGAVAGAGAVAAGISSVVLHHMNESATSAVGSAKMMARTAANDDIKLTHQGKRPIHHFLQQYWVQVLISLACAAIICVVGIVFYVLFSNRRGRKNREDYEDDTDPLMDEFE